MLGVRQTFHARQPSRPSNGLLLSRAQKQLAIFAGALLLASLVWFTASVAPSRRPPSSPSSPTPASYDDLAPAVVDHAWSGPASPATTQSDRITLIVVWAGISVPKYLDLFLRSVEANKASVDLLFVAKREEREGGECVDLGRVGSNVQTLCLSNVEYWSLHRDYLCDRWNCTPDESFEVFQELLSRGVDDNIHSHFRILRGPVFKHYFQDDTRWWGWCDTDTVLGDYGRLVPWAHIEDFDLVQPTHTTDAPEILLYMRGHMTFFNNRQTTLDKLHSFPAFRSRNDWLTGKKPVPAMEEEDFSTFIFFQAPHITFFAWDALLGGHFRTMSLVPHLTSFWGAIPLDPYLGLPTPSTVPFLSDAPVSEGQVSLLLGQASGVDIWMDRAKVVSFVPLARGDHVRRFYWRDAAGLVWERSEDWRRYDMGGRQPEMHREALYVHLQMEKRENWFKRLPADALGKNKVLTMGGWDYAEVWRWVAKGTRLERVWRGARDD